jgi:long-chain acyl-CoA synthetase
MEKSSAHNVAALLERTACVWPRLPAIAHGATTVADYRRFAERATRIATGLRLCGCDEGDRVLIVARNSPAYIEALFACWWSGLVAVPVNAKLHAKELEFVVENTSARMAFVDDTSWGALGSPTTASALREVIVLGSAAYETLASASASAHPAPVRQDDAAWLFYTSGTTGRPKGVAITHGNLHALALCFLADVEAVRPGDSILHPAPLSHGSGLYLFPHVARGAVSVVPESGGFDAAEIAALTHAWGRSLFFAAPTMLKRCVEGASLADAKIDSIKAIVFGGGPMYVADCRAAHAAIGPRLAQIYGQGESPMTITAMDRAVLDDAIARNDEARLGSVGTAQTGIEIRIADASDRELPAGEVGEVLVRGPTVMREYWRNPEATAAALAGGWLHTGDVGALDDAGFLTLKDRSKDLVISGGSNIYPREVEEALLTHPDVAEAAVVGRPHAEWGEEVVACVVARIPLGSESAERAFREALDRQCLASIARFKRPRAYVILDELPKNNTGKVLKTLLRERVRSGGTT